MLGLQPPLAAFAACARSPSLAPSAPAHPGPPGGGREGQWRDAARSTAGKSRRFGASDKAALSDAAHRSRPVQPAARPPHAPRPAGSPRGAKHNSELCFLPAAPRSAGYVSVALRLPVRPLKGAPCG